MKCVRCLLQLRSLKQRGQAGAWSESCTAVARVLPCQTSQIQNIQLQGFRHFHNSRSVLKDRPTAPVELVEDKDKYNQKSLVQDDRFDRVAKENKTKATFIQVVDVFVQQDVRRRGHVEFIYAALKKMPEFGVERDITVYNKLLDVFPKEVFIPRNFIQTMFNHYPRQQECGVEVLEQMENYGVMPNVETKVHLIQIFGTKGHPVRKYQRLMYWFPKFKNLNPYPIPHELLDDPVDLAKFSLKRIADDLDSKITVYQMPCTNVTESGEEITLPHIIGTQSPSQMELLAKHNPNRPVFVEGPFPLWLRNKCVHYYILRADPTPPEEMVCCPVPSSEKQPQGKREVLPPKTPMFVSSQHTTLSHSQSSSCEQVEEPYDPERCFDYPLQLDLNLDRDFGDEEDFDIEDLDEGPVFAMCMTDQGDQATLNQWLSGLQETNPMLGRVPALFRLGSGSKELTVNPDSQPGPDQEHVQPETKEQSAAEEVEKEPQRRDRMNQ